mmetsp:Transcript_38285/g.69329  ORF Transcript_38285/g.69329 Transcript_38285/m.69329 type:complete len:248 (+) Transcript_38285:328-1071(+)
MLAAKDALVFAEAGLSSLKLPPLLDASLPEVMTNMTEMCCAEAEVVRLSLTAVAALPSQEVRAVLWALQLTLGRTAPTRELHGEGSLHIFIQILFLLFLHSTALNLATIIRLIALRALEERHFLHCQDGDLVLMDCIIAPRLRSPLLDNPSLQRPPLHLVIHLQLIVHQRQKSCMAHYILTERTSDVLESKPPARCVSFANHRLEAMTVKDVSTTKSDGGCSIQGLCPANRAPLFAIWKISPWALGR